MRSPMRFTYLTGVESSSTEMMVLRTDLDGTSCCSGRARARGPGNAETPVQGAERRWWERLFSGEPAQVFGKGLHLVDVIGRGVTGEADYEEVAGSGFAEHLRALVSLDVEIPRKWLEHYIIDEVFPPESPERACFNNYLARESSRRGCACHGTGLSMDHYSPT